MVPPPPTPARNQKIHRGRCPPIRRLFVAAQGRGLRSIGKAAEALSAHKLNEAGEDCLPLRAGQGSKHRVGLLASGAVPPGLPNRKCPYRAKPHVGHDTASCAY